MLRGLELRSFLVLVLLQRAQPTTVADLVAAVDRAGFALAGRASKDVADGLRWEVRRGRAVRYRRGLYGPGRVAKVAKHRMRRRIADLRRRSAEAVRAAAAADGLAMWSRSSGDGPRESADDEGSSVPRVSDRGPAGPSRPPTECSSVPRVSDN